MNAPSVTTAMVAYGRGIAEPRLSPSGREVVSLATWNRRPALVAVPVGGGAEEVLTSDLVPRGAGGYGGGAFAWTPDGRALVVVSGGDLWLLPRAGGPARRLTDAGAGGGAGAPAVSPDGAWVAYTRDLRDVAVLSLHEVGAWPRRLSGSADFAADPAWSGDGSRVLWQEWDVPAMPWDSSRVVQRAWDGTGPIEVIHGSSDSQSLQAQPSPIHAGTVALLSDSSGWLNLTLVGEGGTRTLVRESFEHGTPTWVQGQRSFTWSPDGTRLAFARNELGFGRLCVADAETGATIDVARGWHESLTWRGSSLVAVRSGGKTPTQLVAYDTNTWARTVLARGPVAGWKPCLDEPEPVRWTASDGAEVHGRLYRPREPATGPGTRPPLLVWTHGGPTSQTPISFQARVAYFVDKGWAVLLADHRGSTGHGRAYMLAMHERWGDLDVSDTLDGVRAAIERGWCDARRVAAIGASAGGFTTYHLLAREPELFAAGVSLYGVADLLHLDETSHRFERHYLHTIVGPLPAAVDRYRERSPVNLVDRITAPLLVLQGSDDEVVPPAQSQAIVDGLRRLGRTVEHHVYEGEGHGWSRPETVVDELDRTGDFLRRHVLRWRW